MRSGAAFVGLAVLVTALAACAPRAREVASPTIVDVARVAGAPNLPAPAPAPAPESAWAPREEVEVEWHGTFWPAVLLERRAGQRWLVHYEGYGDEWDEIVPEVRIRERRAAEGPDEEAEAGGSDP